MRQQQGGEPLTSPECALLDELVRAHRGAALRLAQRILGDADLAEDAVQRALLQIVVRVRGGDTELLRGDPRAVVLRGTRWAALKIVEHRRTGADAEQRAGNLSAAEVEDQWQRVEARLVVDDIMASLPAHYRDALYLRYFEAQPDSAVASRLAVTLKAYRRRLDRALAAARSSADLLGAGVRATLPAAPTARPRAWLLGLDARLRALRSRSRAQLPAGLGGSAAHLAIAVAVVGLSVGGAGVTGTAPETAPSRPIDGLHLVTGAGAPPALLAAGRSGSAFGGSAGGDGRGHGGGQPGGMPTPLPQPPANGVPLNPLPPPTPPEQALILQVSPVDGYAANHTLVALGMGYACTCFVAYTSPDGGTTWRWFDLPVNNNSNQPTLVLPPAYPADPRIFLAYPSVSSATDCVVADAGATTCDPLPLNGALQVDAQFDSGFPVVYVAQPNLGVVAYDLDTHAVHVLVPDVSAALPPALLAPSAITSTAVYVRAQGMAGLSGTGPELLACDRSFQCVQRNTLSGIGTLTGDLSDPTGAVLGSGEQGSSLQQGTITVDGGATIQSFTVDGGMVGQVEPLGPPSHPVVWVTTDRQHGSSWTRRAWWTEWGSGKWNQLRVPFGPGIEFGITVLPDGRVIAIDPSPGIWCTPDGGATWAHRCPSA